tara:strand:+ start:285 stop:494 length:210 start_codon:yes stop_codon:yes gene_type:complete
MESVISRYEDILNDYAVGVVLAAAAYTDEDLEYVVDQRWSKNDNKEDIVKLVLESIPTRYHEAFKRRVK